MRYLKKAAQWGYNLNEHNQVLTEVSEETVTGRGAVKSERSMAGESQRRGSSSGTIADEPAGRAVSSRMLRIFRSATRTQAAVFVPPQ